jgi:methionyl-tRNA synthetase
LHGLGTSYQPGVDYVTQLSEPWNRSFKLYPIEQLFKKIDRKKDNNPSAQGENVKQETLAESKYLDFETLQDVEIRTGTITDLHNIEKSDKLYQLTVDFGEELGTRQICAGIKKYYQIDEVLGKKSIFVCNLKPRKMAGVASQGMMLMAHDADGKPTIIEAPDQVPNGTRLK